MVSICSLMSAWSASVASCLTNAGRGAPPSRKDIANLTERRGILRGGSLELPAASSPAGRLTPARRVWLSSASEANGLPAACVRLPEGSVDDGCAPAASCAADGEATDAPGEAGGLTFMAWMDRLTRGVDGRHHARHRRARVVRKRKSASPCEPPPPTGTPIRRRNVGGLAHGAP
ncbi:exported protein of unknown function (plasmid) [Ralstonia solanacearum CMR15]|nr:exported protein of unknown function [Ralstonia solanacearum CMR15]